jgi:hypothetical protein
MIFYVSVLYILHWLHLKVHERQNFAGSDSEFFSFLWLPTFVILPLFGQVRLSTVYWVYAEHKIYCQLRKKNILKLT